MRTALFYSVFVLSFMLSFVSEGQDRFMYGRLIDGSTMRGAENLQVINMYTGKGTMSDMHGYFRILCNENDSILIVSVQYERTRIKAIPGVDTVKVLLKQYVYMLPDADIYKFGNYNEFREAVLDLPEKSFKEEEIPWFKDYFAQSKSEMVSVKTLSPITYLYEKYSKKALELKRYDYLIEQERIYTIINAKYNTDVVSRITGITSEEEIKKFMSFCHLNESFIVNAKDYELHLAILDCYRKYRE